MVNIVRAALAGLAVVALAQPENVEVGDDGSISALHDAGACPNRVNSHLDEGFEGIEEEECRARGACWDPSSPGPWCYPLGDRMRTIVLYSAEGQINTGVWSEFGGASPPERAQVGQQGRSCGEDLPRVLPLHG